MTCTVIVGGFFGDEGKGKIAAYLAVKDQPELAVRTGATNAGHTIVHEGKEYKLRIVPSAFVNESTRLLIAAGALFDVRTFRDEVVLTKSFNRVGVDFNSGIIDEAHISRERKDQHLMKEIGSTGSGVGLATVDRALRTLRLARSVPELKPYLTNVSHEVNLALDKGKGVMLEGTQGFYLSLFHGTYPYVTSRDVTASAVCSEVGVGPKRVDEVIVVFKSYVTRVGGGPLENELSEEEAAKRGWLEVATVTGRKRRAAPFNFEMAKRAVEVNGATQVALTKVDVAFRGAGGVREYDRLPPNAKRFIEEVEGELGVPVTLISTGPSVEEVIDRRVNLS